jgi:hypothetical protein
MNAERVLRSMLVEYAVIKRDNIMETKIDKMCEIFEYLADPECLVLLENQLFKQTILNKINEFQAFPKIGPYLDRVLAIIENMD